MPLALNLPIQIWMWRYQRFEGPGRADDLEGQGRQRRFTLPGVVIFKFDDTVWAHLLLQGRWRWCASVARIRAPVARNLRAHDQSALQRKPADMTITTHVFVGAIFAPPRISEGGYEEARCRAASGWRCLRCLFSRYDGEPAAWNRYARGAASVVLGRHITSKVATWRKKEDIKRRLDEGGAICAIEQLCLRRTVCGHGAPRKAASSARISGGPSLRSRRYRPRVWR